MTNLNLTDTILVTGGNGFAGSHLIELLKQEGFQDIQATVYSRDDAISDFLTRDKIHRLDLTDQQATQDLIAKVRPKMIFHLAALAVVGKSFANIQPTILNNLKLQLSLLEAVKENAPQAKILIIGSGMEYDLINYQTDRGIREDHPLGPASPYGVAKVAQDLLALSYFYSYKLAIVRARPFNHIGERQTADFAVASFAKQIALIEKGDQKEVRVGNLSAVRDFTDVKDICRAYLLLMEKGRNGEVYNIGSGKGVSVQFVLDQLISLADRPIPVVIDQNRLRPSDIKKAVANNQKIRDLGWAPKIALTETLKRILNYWREKV